MIKYYVKLNKKYAKSKVFNDSTQAEQYYRYLQEKYNTNCVIMSAKFISK